MFGATDENSPAADDMGMADGGGTPVSMPTEEPMQSPAQPMPSTEQEAPVITPEPEMTPPVEEKKEDAEMPM